jgi:hypothetical protein
MLSEMPQEAHDRRLRDSACALMELHWDGLYRVWWSDGAYRAERADGGGSLAAPSAADLREKVRMDFCLRPVSRNPL